MTTTTHPADLAIFNSVKENHFFAQMTGVTVTGATKAKLYGDTIYMNGIAVHLIAEEVTIFNEILQEADWYFANYEDTDVTSISNYIILRKMFTHYFPNYKDQPNRFNITVPYCFNQLANETYES